MLKRVLRVMAIGVVVVVGCAAVAYGVSHRHLKRERLPSESMEPAIKLRQVVTMDTSAPVVRRRGMRPAAADRRPGPRLRDPRRQPRRVGRQPLLRPRPRGWIVGQVEHCGVLGLHCHPWH